MDFAIGQKGEMMDDLISRQAAIDALDKRFDDVPMELTTEILQLRRDLRERIPSAQPATNCSEIPNGSDDTISRQAAIDFIDAGHLVNPNEPRWSDNEVVNFLKSRPSTQPEIIRCRDCKYWMPYDWMFSEIRQSQNINDYPEDEIGCEYCDMTMKADDFCSRAERKK